MKAIEEEIGRLRERVRELNDPATNNRAGRQLRPAVIRRKLSCGNRTPRGAEAFEQIASVVETCAGQGRSAVDYLTATVSLGMEPLPLR